MSTHSMNRSIAHVPQRPALSRLALVAVAGCVASLCSACAVGVIEGVAGDEESGWDAGKRPGPRPHPRDAGGDPTPTPSADDDGGAPSPPSETDASTPPVSDTGGAPAPTDDAGGAPPPPSTDAAPPPPPPPATGYPSGPYGLNVGQTFPNLSFQGYRDGTGAWTTLTMGDYYDPTGSRHVNGLYLDVSASWCGACRAEAGDLPAMYAGTYKARGGRFLTAMIQDSSSSPATQSTVDEWKTTFSLNFDIVADGTESTLPKSGGVGLPHNYVIDTRTMKVSKVIEGADPGATSIPALDAVLTKNGG